MLGNKPVSVSDALRQLSSLKSTRSVYDALVIIRTSYSKGTDAATKLRHHGGIELLVKVLLQIKDNKCLDVCLSILGNCCLDEKVRLCVLKLGAIKTICDILCTTEKESIRHRACRAVANLCENIACCDAIHDDHPEVVEKIVNYLIETQDKDCKVSYCRALRMLSDTEEHKETVLQHGAVQPIGSMLLCDDVIVQQAALKAITHFIYNCSEECVRRVVAADVLSSVVTLASSPTSDLSAPAMSLVLSIAATSPNLRPYLGSTGAVKLCVRRVSEALQQQQRLTETTATNCTTTPTAAATTSSSSTTTYQTIDTICQCCRDARNRSELRELGGIRLLVDLLSVERFGLIHNRVISSLVSFIYDDAGFAELLNCGVVRALVPHLYRTAGVTAQADVIDLSWLTVDRPRSVHRTMQFTDEMLSSCSSDFASNLLEVSRTSESEEISLDKLPTEVVEGAKPVDCDSGFDGEGKIMRAELTENLPSKSEDELMAVEPFSAAALLDVATAGKEKLPVKFSIDSPTYKAVSAWRMDTDDHSADSLVPRNIYEGALLYSDIAVHRSKSVSGSPVRSASSSPHRSYSASPCRTVGSSPYSSPSSAWSVDSGCSSPRSAGLHISRSWSSDIGSVNSPSRASTCSEINCWSPCSSPYSPLSTRSFVSSSQFSSPSYPDIDTVTASISESDLAKLDGCKGEIEQLSLTADLLSPNSPVSIDAHLQGRKVSKIDSASVEGNAIGGRSNLVGTDGEKMGSGAISPLVKLTNDKSTGCSTVKQGEQVNVDSSKNDITKGSTTKCSSTRQIKQAKDSSDKADVFDEASFNFTDDFDSDDGDNFWDVCAYQRNRENERKFSHLIDLANRMYGIGPSSAAEPDPQHKPKRRRQSSHSSLNTKNNPSANDRVTGSTTAAEMSIDASKLDDDPEASGETRSCKKNEGSLKSGVESEQDLKCESKKESKSSTTSASSGKRLTVKNILTLISRISHLPDSSTHLIDTSLLCSLLDYVALVSSPVPTASRILLRLSKDCNCFESLVLCMFPLLVDRRLDNCKFKKPVECDDLEKIQESSKSSSSGPKNLQKIEGNVSVVEKPKSCESPKRIGSDILANLSTLASSPFGQGVLLHILFRGNASQRTRCAISLCYICRSSESRLKFMVEMKCTNILMDSLATTDSQLFNCTVLALGYLIRRSVLSDRCTVYLGSCPPSLATDQIDFDVRFLLDDNFAVDASRKVLVASSDVFAAMLTGRFREASEAEVHLPSVSGDAFQVVINWSHGLLDQSATEQTTVDCEVLLECFELAHRFQLSNKLLDYLFQLITKKFTPETDFASVFNVLKTFATGAVQQEFVLYLFSSENLSLETRCVAVANILSGPEFNDFTSTLCALLMKFLG